MDEVFSRFIEDLVARIHGPFLFRVIFQPAMAVFFAIRDGHKDAQEHRPPYFWALFTQPMHRRDLIREGWKATGKVFFVAIAIDVLYQLIVLRWIYPLEALFTAVLLAFLPYLLLRGPVNRFFRGRYP